MIRELRVHPPAEGDVDRRHAFVEAFVRREVETAIKRMISKISVPVTDSVAIGSSHVYLEAVETFVVKTGLKETAITTEDAWTKHGMPEEGRRERNHVVGTVFSVVNVGRVDNSGGLDGLALSSIVAAANRGWEV